IAVLKRRAHALALAWRHAAGKHQRLGSAADSAVERTHENLSVRRIRQRRVADFSAARRRHPDRSCQSHGSLLSPRHDTMRDLTSTYAVKAAAVFAAIMALAWHGRRTHHPF